MTFEKRESEGVKGQSEDDSPLCAESPVGDGVEAEEMVLPLPFYSNVFFVMKGPCITFENQLHLLYCEAKI